MGRIKHVQHRTRAENARAAGNAGTGQFKMYNMRNTRKYLFYLRCEIALHKREKTLIKFYTFSNLLKMLRHGWYEMSDELKKELGYD